MHEQQGYRTIRTKTLESHTGNLGAWEFSQRAEVKSINCKAGNIKQHGKSSQQDLIACRKPDGAIVKRNHF